MYLPPFTSPFVQIADSDKVVIIQTTAEMAIINKE